MGAKLSIASTYFTLIEVSSSKYHSSYCSNRAFAGGSLEIALIILPNLPQKYRRRRPRTEAAPRHRYAFRPRHRSPRPALKWGGLPH
jgi:hypothetical protein